MYVPCLERGNVVINIVFQLLSSKSLADLNFMTYLLSNDKNFKNYRQSIEEVHASEPAIPYLGVFLTDYTFLCESKPIFFNPATLIMNPEEANGAGGSPNGTPPATIRMRSGSEAKSSLINIDRLTTLGAKLREITSLQERPFAHMTSSSAVREAILAERILDSNELFNLSKLREEKGGFHEALGIVSGRVKRSSKQKHLSVIDLSDSLIPNIAGVLGDREWTFLLTSALTKNFNDKDIIMTEEKPFTAFYRYFSTHILNLDDYFSEKIVSSKLSIAQYILI
jgi:hypothetical protein